MTNQPIRRHQLVAFLRYETWGDAGILACCEPLTW
jgi:hypothetical protein